MNGNNDLDLLFGPKQSDQRADLDPNDPFGLGIPAAPPIPFGTAQQFHPQAPEQQGSEDPLSDDSAAQPKCYDDDGMELEYPDDETFLTAVKWLQGELQPAVPKDSGNLLSRLKNKATTAFDNITRDTSLNGKLAALNNFLELKNGAFSHLGIDETLDRMVTNGNAAYLLNTHVFDKAKDQAAYEHERTIIARIRPLIEQYENTFPQAPGTGMRGPTGSF